jgi:hypothetical protein
MRLECARSLAAPGTVSNLRFTVVTPERAAQMNEADGLLEPDVCQAIDDKGEAEPDRAGRDWNEIQAATFRVVPVPQPAPRGGVKDGLSQSPG